MGKKWCLSSNLNTFTNKVLTCKGSQSRFVKVDELQLFQSIECLRLVDLIPFKIRVIKNIQFFKEGTLNKKGLRRGRLEFYWPIKKIWKNLHPKQTYWRGKLIMISSKLSKPERTENLKGLITFDNTLKKGKNEAITISTSKKLFKKLITTLRKDLPQTQSSHISLWWETLVSWAP